MEEATNLAVNLRAVALGIKILSHKVTLVLHLQEFVTSVTALDEQLIVPTFEVLD
jgi:hypothetical protein